MKQLILLFFVILSFANNVFAQDQLLQLAKEYYAKKEYTKSAELFATLYQNSPNEAQIYEGYINSLIETKNFKLTEKIIKQKVKTNKANFNYLFDLCKLYKAQGETKKVNNLYEDILNDYTQSEQQVRDVATLFEKNNELNLAIEAYEKGKKKSNLPYLFSSELAMLYDRKGDFEKATESLLDMAALSYENMEPAKTALLSLFTQADKIETVRKKIIKRINAEAENTIYPDILSWLYIQQKDYESAFVQVKALDIRLKEQGRRPLNFARIAAKEKEYNAADMAFQYVMDLGQEAQFYFTAWEEKLDNAKNRIIDNPNATPLEINTTLQQYEEFLKANTKQKNANTIRTYAMLLARYADRVDEAISLLKEAVKSNNLNPSQRGYAKLDLGDYYLLKSDNWEATLLYSQVDKEFKNDFLGEDARYRNARLSYFMGDYEWAQTQLDVLKASTTELIANDALDLSVLITENIPADSNLLPLQMFSRSELLFFQNKTEQATNTLDSINSLYPSHPLADNILMARAKIAYNQHDFTKAIDLYKDVAIKFKEDILADDAVFQIAKIYDEILKNKAEAMIWYEKIILEYSNSSFITDARKAFRRLREDKPDVEQ